MNAGFVWLAASSGALSLLTPCVFPMIPITISYFAQHGGQGRRLVWRNALFFALGIVASFTILGLALALLVGAAGLAALASNAWVNILLAAGFVGFALSLLGVLQIRLPFGLVNRADSYARRHGAGTVGALLVGVVFTLTSFSCTAPLIGTLLVLAAQGSWQQPLMGMLIYSTVFALPFVLLALVPHWLTRLPKSGSWMTSMKMVLGILELAAAIKFLANADLVWGWHVLTRTVVLLAWALSAFLIALLLLAGPESRNKAPRWKLDLRRLALCAAWVWLGVWLAAGISGRRMGELEALLPPKAATADLNWTLNDLPATLAKAKETGKNVFIDFTGYTCTNCRWMEANVFTEPDVKAALEGFELARLFTDGEGETFERQQEQQQRWYGTVALPFYAIVDAYGRTVTTFAGLTRNPDEFLRFLNRQESIRIN